MDSQQNSDKAAASHTHDDRYFTESETDARLATKSDTGHYHDSIRIYDEVARIAGLSYKITNTFTVPGIVIDGRTMDLIRNTDQVDAKINAIAIDWSTTPWRLKVNLWINGVTYTRYIDFAS
ncbi:MAG: hypothetical protein ACRDBO_02075 [Lachnospiraceae bacterium]